MPGLQDNSSPGFKWIGCVRDPHVLRAGILFGVLAAVICLVLIVLNVIYGRNYSPFIVRLDGVDQTQLQGVTVEYRSPFGSEGTLRFDEELGFFRTENWSQPIASIVLRCPADVNLKGVRATLWYMNINAVYGGTPLQGGGQVIGGLEDSVQQVSEDFLLVDLRFRPLSTLSISKFSRAMNWKGDLALFVDCLTRAGVIALGVVLCVFSLRVFWQTRSNDSRYPQFMALRSGNGSTRRSWFAWSSLILIIGSVIYGRDRLVFLFPSMEFEDGTQVFAYFYEHRGFAELLRFKFGYVPLIPNILGFCSVRIPRVLVPYWMSVVPAIFAILFYSMPFRRCFSGVFPCRTSAWVTSVVVCLAPLSSQLMYSNTDYMIWNLLGILFLLSLVDPAESKSSEGLLATALSLLVCSHPLSLLLLLILGIRWAFEGRLQWYWVFSAGMALLYQSFGVEHDSVTRELGLLGQLERILQAANESALVCVRLGARALAGPVFFDKCIAAYLQGWLGNCAILAAGGVIGVGVFYVRLHRHREKIALAFAVVFFITFLGILSRGIEWVSDFGFHTRYTYIQSMLVLCVSVCLLFQGLQWGYHRFAGSGFGSANLAKMLLSAVLISWFWGQNLQRGYLFGSTENDGSYSYASPQNGLIMRDFFDKLTRLEAAPDFDGEVFLQAEKVNDWRVVIDTRKKIGAQAP